MLDVIKEILISGKEFTETVYKRLHKALVGIESNLTDSDGGMYLTVDSLTGSNNISLRKVNVKQYGFDKMYMDKDLKEDKLYQIIDQFDERKLTPTKIY